MKERPILFSGEMVRAILDGRKTQTRRVIKDPLDKTGGQYCVEHADDDPNVIVHIHNPKCEGYCDYVCNYSCPFGEPGDCLWVRETHRLAAWRDAERKVAYDYRASPEETRTPWFFLPEDVYIKARDSLVDELFTRGIRPDLDGQYRWEYGQSPGRWHPSIHMPRWASRITLRVTGIRVERLHSISETDAQAEGAFQQGKVGDDTVSSLWTMTGEGWRWDSAREVFAAFWQSLNTSRPGHTWDDTPWVWVVDFQRVQ